MRIAGVESRYEHLRPEERVALIMAACARGDEPDVLRLSNSTPREKVFRADTFPVSQALLEVTLQEHASQLALAVRFWQAQWAADDAEDPKVGDRLLAVVRVYAYLVLTYAAGWARFAAGRSITPEGLASFTAPLPGGDVLEQSRKVAESYAATAADVERHFERFGEHGPVLTPEGHAAELEKVYAARLEFWQAH